MPPRGFIEIGVVSLTYNTYVLHLDKKASIRWQDSAPPISGCLSCNNRQFSS